MRSTYLLRITGILLMVLAGFVSRANENIDQAPLNGGCITSANEWVLIGAIPSTITATVASGGTNPGNYSYQWQRSTDNIFFTDIPGATSQNLAFTATLTQTTYFQRKVTCGTEVAYTGSVTKNMTSTQYWNMVTSGTFTRNNCAAGATGSSVTYTVPANTYSSLMSQADANAKAQNDVNANGQNYANSNGTCIWYSVFRSVNFSKNNCATGGVGSTVTYTVPAAKYSSTISQADADAKAQNEINSNGQTNANNVGYCTWYNAARSQAFTRNNCLSGTTPATVTYNVAAGAHSSTISQTDADQKAINDVNANGQNYANANGSCTNLFFSFKPNGGTPSVFGITVKSTSGTVLFSRSVDRDFSEDFTYAVVPEASSYIVEMAAMSPMYAIVNGVQKSVLSTVSWNTSGNVITIIASQTPRYYNVTRSGTFIRNNCGSGYTGSTVTYTVPAGAYWSDVSQSDADQLAINAVNANGQAYANTNGTCTAVQNVSVVLKNSFITTTTAFTVTFYRSGALQQTNSFPLTKGASTTINLPAGSNYTMTFNAPSSVLGAPYSYILTPPGTSWSPAGSTTVNTGTVVYTFGTSYTINISSFD